MPIIQAVHSHTHQESKLLTSSPFRGEGLLIPDPRRCFGLPRTTHRTSLGACMHQQCLASLVYPLCL